MEQWWRDAVSCAWAWRLREVLVAFGLALFNASTCYTYAMFLSSDFDCFRRHQVLEYVPMEICVHVCRKYSLQMSSSRYFSKTIGRCCLFSNEIPTHSSRKLRKEPLARAKLLRPLRKLMVSLRIVSPIAYNAVLKKHPKLRTLPLDRLEHQRRGNSLGCIH